jgi:hypothetical protein
MESQRLKVPFILNFPNTSKKNASNSVWSKLQGQYGLGSSIQVREEEGKR